MPQEWHKMATNGSFSEAFRAISLCPESTRNGAFLGMGRAELIRVQTIRLPGLVSVHSVRHQPTSGA